MRLVGEVNTHRTDFLQPQGKASIRHRQVWSRLRAKRPHLERGRKTSFRLWLLVYRMAGEGILLGTRQFIPTPM